LRIYTDLWKTRLKEISCPTITKVLLDRSESSTPSQEPLYSLTAEMVDKLHSGNRTIHIRKLTCPESQLSVEVENLTLYASIYRKEYVKTCFEELDSALHYPISSCAVWLNVPKHSSSSTSKSLLNATYLNTVSSMEFVGYRGFSSLARQLEQKPSISNFFFKFKNGKSRIEISLGELATGPDVYALSYLAPKNATASVCLIELKCRTASSKYDNPLRRLTQIISASQLIKKSLPDFSKSSAVGKVIYSLNAHYSS